MVWNFNTQVIVAVLDNITRAGWGPQRAREISVYNLLQLDAFRDQDCTSITSMLLND